MKIEHILQPAILCRDIDRTMDFLHALLGAYPSERIEIPYAGVRNAVYAFENMTFLELIEPYDPKASAMRLLERNGEGWHMLSVDVEDESPEKVDERLKALGTRVVHKSATEHVKGEWHLHPRDAGGVLLLLAMRNDFGENGAYAGWHWREYVKTNTRVVRSIAGVSVVCEDADTGRADFEKFGIEFAHSLTDEGDIVLQANLARGTFFQLRTPGHERAPSAEALKRRGPGLFHLCFAVNDLDTALAAVERAGARIGRKTETGAWTAPETTMGIPIEFRC